MNAKQAKEKTKQAKGTIADIRAEVDKQISAAASQKASFILFSVKGLTADDVKPLRAGLTSDKFTCEHDSGCLKISW